MSLTNFATPVLRTIRYTWQNVGDLCEARKCNAKHHQTLISPQVDGVYFSWQRHLGKVL